MDSLLTELPQGTVINDNSVSWTDPDNVLKPNETQLSGNSDASITLSYPSDNAPDSSLLTWDISLTDNRGTNRVIRNISQ